ncbi:hypothetical protein EDB87DRAFT_1355887 [Lactarius vividus]|nr:hypothetical protein EDB87DRAFT_1355887 [Lactarius vividus]
MAFFPLTSTSLLVRLLQDQTRDCRPHLPTITTHRNAYRHPTVVLLASMAPRTPRTLLLTVTRLATLGLFFWAPSFGIGALSPRLVQFTCGLARCASARGEETCCNAESTRRSMARVRRLSRTLARRAVIHDMGLLHLVLPVHAPRRANWRA